MKFNYINKSEPPDLAWNATLTPTPLTEEDRELMRRLAAGWDEDEQRRMIDLARPVL